MTTSRHASFLGFLTPVRGHRFAARPPGARDPRRGVTVDLRREPDNPADPLAVAVWLDAGGPPWRLGYLERAVAARIGPRLDAGVRLSSRLAGWWDAPSGDWRRPVVAIEPQRVDAQTVEPRPVGARARWELSLIHI